MPLAATSSSSPAKAFKPEHIFPFLNATQPTASVAPASASLSATSYRARVLERYAALHAPTVARCATPDATVPVLYTTLGVVWVYFAQFDLRKDDARQPHKNIVDVGAR